jgi:hypothetical protein
MEGQHHFLGILKEMEVRRLKYVAIDGAHLRSYLNPSEAALNRALKSMTNLKELIIVCDVSDDEAGITSWLETPKQMSFYTELPTGGRLPAYAVELPEAEKKYGDWKPTNGAKMISVHGRRAI